MDAIERADQLHAGEVRAVQLGHHPLQLAAVEQRHHRGFDHVAEVVAEGDLVAAELLRLRVETAPAHPRAEVAGVPVGDLRHGEDVRFKELQGDLQPRGVLLQLFAVCRAVSGVHGEKGQLERHRGKAAEHPQQHRQQHGVLPAGDADRDPVPRLDQPVVPDGRHERRPDRLAVFCNKAPLRLLPEFQLLRHIAAPPSVGYRYYIGVRTACQRIGARSCFRTLSRLRRQLP